MNKSLATCLFCATTLSTAFSQTVRDLRLDAPVDSNTIAVAYQQVTNAIATAVRLGQLDQESLARAIQVGQDLHLVETTEAGWVVGVSNIVNVQQAHVPGVLFVGSIIYGAPEDGGHILLDGADFYYNRQIPGSLDPEAGLGNLVTDPYLDWRLHDFFTDWGATNAAMWAAMMEINDLPASLAADLQAYSFAAGQIAQDIAAINATNAVIRTVIENALSQASSGGGGQSWTTSSTSSSTINCADHCITICNNSSANKFTVNLPTSTGTAHCRVVFTEASSLGQNGAWIDYAGNWYGTGNYDCSAFRPYDSYGYEMYDPNSGDPMYCSVVVVDIQEAGSGLWFVDWKGYR